MSRWHLYVIGFICHLISKQFRNIDDTLVHKVVPWNKCLCLRKKKKKKKKIHRFKIQQILFDISRRNGMRAPVESNQRLYNLHLLFLRHAYVLFFYDIFFRIIIEKIDCQICACSSPTASPPCPSPAVLFPNTLPHYFLKILCLHSNYLQ